MITLLVLWFASMCFAATLGIVVAALCLMARDD
jgi:hypothetical protein